MAPDETPAEEVADDEIMSARDILAVPVPGYHWPLDLARQYARSRVPQRQNTAVELLRGLAVRYPHALAIGQELVFVLMELEKHPAAELELAKLDETFRNLDMESLCRWGRFFKDMGDRHADLDWVTDKLSSSPMLSAQYYQKAIAKYGQAYEIAEDHYPGINKATLLLILAALKATAGGLLQARPPEEVASLAEKILKDSRWESPSLEDKKVWFPATRGEAHLLREEWADAESHYFEAKENDHATPHARESMRRQVRRICDAFAKLNVKLVHPFDHPDTFFGVKAAGSLPSSAPPPTIAP